MSSFVTNGYLPVTLE
ncbi:RNA polymerase subunit RPO18, partial [Monkeypox virus]